MTPKEKAEQLMNKFRPHSKYWDFYNDEPLEENHAKQCALIAVDEIINNNKKIPANVDGLHTNENSNYWQEVKKEIKKL
jgi:hypothetical protein